MMKLTLFSLKGNLVAVVGPVLIVTAYCKANFIWAMGVFDSEPLCHLRSLTYGDLSSEKEENKLSQLEFLT